MDKISSSLFMSATMLDKAIATAGNVREKSLGAAFDFLRVSIDASHLAFNLSVNSGGVREGRGRGKRGKGAG